ncbi:MAG: alanyl-tRNA editing protein [Gammaproteobacteria bacterium]
MQKIFWDNPYQTELNTKVISVEKEKILFEETIIYSFSGGQESDRAFINQMPVIYSEIKGNLIFYTLPDNHGLRSGDFVYMEIDWIRRFRLMRLHFAAELILELITKKFQLEKVGAHISELKSRIDFKANTKISSLFDDLLREYNQIISSDKIIEVGFSDIKNQRRYWKIEGFAKVPCGGTHVKSTAEVGSVNLKRSRPGKGIERIEITLVNS